VTCSCRVPAADRIPAAAAGLGQPAHDHRMGTRSRRWHGCPSRTADQDLGQGPRQSAVVITGRGRAAVRGAVAGPQTADHEAGIHGVGPVGPLMITFGDAQAPVVQAPVLECRSRHGSQSAWPPPVVATGRGGAAACGAGRRPRNQEPVAAAHIPGHSGRPARRTHDHEQGLSRVARILVPDCRSRPGSQGRPQPAAGGDHRFGTHRRLWRGCPSRNADQDPAARADPVGAPMITGWGRTAACGAVARPQLLIMAWTPGSAWPTRW
jgi:hypothetical protein